MVFDRFHVTKVINEAVDKVRKAEVGRNPILRNSKYLFLKNHENLTVYQQSQLETIKLSGLNLKTMKALNIHEAFQQIYQAPQQMVLEISSWHRGMYYFRLSYRGQMVSGEKVVVE